MAEKLPGRRTEPSVYRVTGVAESRRADAYPNDQRVIDGDGIGHAFSIDELMLVRDWCGRRGLRVTVQLDHAEDGIAFEELLSLTPCGHVTRCLTLWRQGDAVVVRGTDGPGHLHRSVAEALRHWERDRSSRRLRLNAWLAPLLRRSYRSA